MRKRRVLAALLALSLVVSGNSMTVLAAETGEEQSVVTAQEEETQEIAPEEDKETEEAAGEAPADEDTSEPSTEGEASEEEKPEENDPPASEDEGDVETEPVEEGVETEDQDSSVSGNDVTADTEETEEDPEESAATVRMMTFTDDAGLRITFDVNAAEKNAEKVTITDGVVTGVDGSVEGVIDLREKEITQIGANAFNGKTKITYVMLPKTVKSLGEGAFEDCTALKGVSIPSRLETVGDSAFKGCTALTQLALPNSVISIGANAFYGDSRLFMLNMVSVEYSKLETIGDSAFKNCSSLELFCSDENYILPESLTTIGSSAFYGCVKIDKVVMGDGIVSLGESAYAYCSGIKKMTVSARIQTVPQRAFLNCTELIELTFSTTVRGAVTIESNAFENCSKLGSLDLPQKVSVVKEDAFKGCTALRRIYIRNDDAELKNGAFPNANPDLCIIGSKNSAAKDYAENNGKLRFIPIDESGRTDYYTYAQKLTGPTGDGKIQIKVTNNKDSVTKEFSTIQDINGIKNTDGIGDYDKGVKAGTDCYVVINWPDGLAKVIRLVSGSLKCNGEKITTDAGKRYTFKMPEGGATITAEFEYITPENVITGNENTIEGRLSSDVNYDYQRNIGYMKVGQSTKFYLTNSYGGAETRIPASKVEYRVSKHSESGVVSVDAKGNVKALKAGTAIVEAEVKTDSGTVPVDVTIVVESTGIDHISVLLPNADTEYTIERDEKGISGISISTTEIAKDYQFTIKAAAFGSEEDDEEMAVPFTWASSDTKVAKVAKASTAAAASENTIIIPKGTDGEATITVSATGVDKKKVIRKFIVCVQNYEPRLNAAKITVNPKQVDGATTIGIIDAYGKAVDNDKIIEAYDAKSGEKVGGFKFTFVKKEGVVSTYQVSAVPGMKQQTYNVKLKINVETVAKPYEPSLAIVIKESFPNPTVTFDKKNKINLFYANDETEIEPIIGKLGNDVISEYSLEPLTEKDHKNYEDDEKFIKNFTIDPKTGVITQKIDQLLKNKSGKPVLTGYLVLKFEGYDSKQVKKYKITIPTQTTAPSYVLDRTTDTFGNLFEGDQVVYLQLLDKKTKKPIEWDEGYSDTDVLKIDTSSTFGFANAELEGIDQKVDGEIKKCVNIKVTVPESSLNKTGKLVMKVRNGKWAEGKEFKYTYNIKIDTNPHKLSLKKATISFNANYPERVETFALVSNHRDETIKGTQNFEAQFTSKTADDYQKLSVTCENGEGSIALKPQGQDIKAGNYKYVYKYTDMAGKENKVTLTVKVSKTTPTVTLKGTNAFNLAAKTTDQGVTRYVETSEMTMTVKNLPDDPKYQEITGESGGNAGGDQTSETEEVSALATTELNQERNPQFYTLDAEETFAGIVFATRGFEAEKPQDYFNFEWVEDENGAGGKIRVSLKKLLATKTYSLKMTPIYRNNTNSIRTAKPISFSIKIYNSSISSVKLSAKGKINLLDRGGECTEKNGIRYTPTISNLKDTLQEVKLLAEYPKLGDYADDTKLSPLFEAKITEDKKSFYIVPKEGVELENKKTYVVYAWLLMDGYRFGSQTGDGIYTNPIKVSTAEILPKVKTDKTAVDLYLSSKSYDATFVVQKKDEKAIGAIEGIDFGEKDEKARESFDIEETEKLEDGSLLVHIKLKQGVSYGCNTTNKVTMYIKFKGQGKNTAGTSISMNVKINK